MGERYQSVHEGRVAGLACGQHVMEACTCAVTWFAGSEAGDQAEADGSVLVIELQAQLDMQLRR